MWISPFTNPFFIFYFTVQIWQTIKEVIFQKNYFWSYFLKISTKRPSFSNRNQMTWKKLNVVSSRAEKISNSSNTLVAFISIIPLNLILDLFQISICFNKFCILISMANSNFHHLNNYFVLFSKYNSLYFLLVVHSNGFHSYSNKKKKPQNCSFQYFN